MSAAQVSNLSDSLAESRRMSEVSLEEKMQQVDLESKEEAKVEESKAIDDDEAISRLPKDLMAEMTKPADN